jgi:hypothetical protein
LSIIIIDHQKKRYCSLLSCDAFTINNSVTSGEREQLKKRKNVNFQIAAGRLWTLWWRVENLSAAQKVLPFEMRNLVVSGAKWTKKS